MASAVQSDFIGLLVKLGILFLLRTSPKDSLHLDQSKHTHLSKIQHADAVILNVPFVITVKQTNLSGLVNPLNCLSKLNHIWRTLESP